MIKINIISVTRYWSYKKRCSVQVEYFNNIKSFSEITSEIKKQEFGDCNFSFEKIKEIKFDFFGNRYIQRISQIGYNKDNVYTIYKAGWIFEQYNKINL